jgi:hypothetical protein
MSFLNSSFSSQTNSNLMDYLISKIENRIITMQITRTAVNNIFDLKDLMENKKNMIKHFYEIEDDLKQVTNAIKALIAQNKDYSDQILILQRKNNNLESQGCTDLKMINEINLRNVEIISENEVLHKSLVELRSSNSYLNERNFILESEIKIKEKEIGEFIILNNNLSKRIEKLEEENSLLKMQLERESKEIEYNQSYNETFKHSGSSLSIHKEKNLVSPKNSNQNSKRINSDKENINKSRSEEYENLRSILSERENNKKLINEKIKNHFNTSSDKIVTSESNQDLMNKKTNFTQEREENRTEEKEHLNLQETERYIPASFGSSPVISQQEKTQSKNNSQEKENTQFYNKDIPMNYYKNIDTLESQKHIQDFSSEDGKKPENFIYENSMHKSKSTEIITIKNKADFLSKLILRALRSSEIIEILNKKFGIDFMQKLLSNKVSDDFLIDVDQSLCEIEKQMSNYKQGKCSTSSKKNLNKFDEETSPPLSEDTKRSKIIPEVNEEIEEREDKRVETYQNEPNSNYANYMSSYSNFNNTLRSSCSMRTTQRKNKKCPNTMRSLSTNLVLSKSFSDLGGGFENSLRSYKAISPVAKKKFNNFMNPYGKYFDKDVQSGARSKHDLTITSFKRSKSQNFK